MQLQAHTSTVDSRNREEATAVTTGGRRPKLQLRPVVVEEAIEASEEILVVDDMGGNRRLHCFLAGGLGYPTISVADGAEALDYLRQWCPRLVLLDIEMPNVDGRAVLEQMRNEGLDEGVRVAIITAHSREENLDLLDYSSVVAVVEKPMTRHKIQALLDASEPAEPEI